MPRINTIHKHMSFKYRVVGEGVLKVLPHALDADVALGAREHRLHLVLELGGHLELWLGVVDVVLGKGLDGADLGVTPLDVALATEPVVVVGVRGQREVLAEALVAVLALEGLVHRGHLAGLGCELVDDPVERSFVISCKIILKYSDRNSFRTFYSEQEHLPDVSLGGGCGVFGSSGYASGAVVSSITGLR